MTLGQIAEKVKMSKGCRKVSPKSVIDTLPARERRRIESVGRLVPAGSERVLTLLAEIGRAQRRQSRRAAQVAIRSRGVRSAPLRVAHERRRHGTGRPAGRRIASRGTAGDDGPSGPAIDGPLVPSGGNAGDLTGVGSGERR